MTYCFKSISFVSVQNRCKSPLGRCCGHLPDFWILLFLVIFNTLRQLYRHRQEVFIVFPSALDSLDDFLEAYLERNVKWS